MRERGQGGDGRAGEGRGEGIGKGRSLGGEGDEGTEARIARGWGDGGHPPAGDSFPMDTPPHLTGRGRGVSDGQIQIQLFSLW